MVLPPKDLTMTTRERTYMLLAVLIGAGAAHYYLDWKMGETIAHDAWIALIAFLNPETTAAAARRLFVRGKDKEPADA